MAWKFVDSDGCDLITVSNDCELELFHCIVDTVSTYYFSEV